MTTERRDAIGRLRPDRKHEVSARKNAIVAARALLKAGGNRNRDDIATEYKVTPSGVSLALIILLHGTEAEIASVENGERGIRPVYDAIIKRVPVEERLKTKTTHTISARRKEEVKNDALIWRELRQALDLICGLPLPADVVKIGKRNNGRAAVIDKKIVDAFSWLTEFSDAWTK